MAFCYLLQAKYKKVVDFLKEQKSFLLADPSPVNQEVNIIDNDTLIEIKR